MLQTIETITYGLMSIICVSFFVFVISKIIFNRKINKALAEGGNKKGRKLIGSDTVASIALGVLVAAVLGICICFPVYLIIDHMDKASNKEPAGCNIGIIFEMEEDSYTPDPGKFILRSKMKAGDDKCLIYAAEDEEVTPCLVVYKIKDASEISKAEVSFSNDKKVTSKFIDFGDEVKGFYPTSLQNAEFPGTFGITITDKNGEELGGIGFSLG